MNYAAGTGSAGIAIGDLDGDKTADLAVANAGDERGNGDVGVLLNSGGGTTFFASNTAAGVSPNSVALVDLTGDGRLDLAVADGLVVVARLPPSRKLQSCK
jgi:hypothetical protein